MGPIITEVEYVDETLSGFETSEPDHALVLDRLISFQLRIWDPDPSAVSKLEFMEMRPVPSCKRIVNCGSKVGG